MRHVSLKIYGAFHPVCEAVHEALYALEPDVMGHDEALCGPWLLYEKDMVRISFEGAYFPLEEALAALEAGLLPETEGKLDVIDMDAWVLTRFTPEQNENGTTFQAATRSLNHVLDYSGH